MLHEVCCQDVDVELVCLDIGILLAHLGEFFVPIGHGVRDAVRLGGRSQLLARPALCQLEGIAHDPFGNPAW